MHEHQQGEVVPDSSTQQGEIHTLEKQALVLKQRGRRLRSSLLRNMRFINVTNKAQHTTYPDYLSSPEVS
jgi:hypothetical protein